MKPVLRFLIFFCSVACLLGVHSVVAQEASSRGDLIRAEYAKFEHMIPMRDGVKLYTAVYVPYDLSASEQLPIIILRTPYSAGPYGANAYRSSLGPSEAMERDRYIFAYQDVRGCYMSEGTFVNMRPHIPNKKGQEVDESTDTFDTIEWLVKNIEGNNGRVGQWGISYPGFYTSAGCIDSHPALKAVSPQAPIADWFFDDFHRNGAFVLPMGFGFFSSFGQARPEPTPKRSPGFRFPTRDGYQFYLDLGPLSNINEKYFKGEIEFWNDIVAHPNYDQFWQDRNLLPHLKNITADVLVVGGWFDTEDLYGPLHTYRAIEAQNKNIKNTLVMGPWYHGGWNRTDGSSLGDASFDFASSNLYRNEVEREFFRSALKQGETKQLPEAFVFETGANRWRSFDQWPPAKTKEVAWHFTAGGQLAEDVNVDPQVTSGATAEASLAATKESTAWYSDPAKPVPYTQEVTTRWARNYMTEDQRFAAQRPDVLVFRSPVLNSDVTIAGPLEANLFFSTTGADADLIVKLIDEYPGHPPTQAADDPIADDYPSGRQQLVRAGVMRGRFRNGFTDPQPMQAGQVEEVNVPLRDVLHTFKRGHRIMIQVQSTWFPFIDRNPQSWVDNIFQATEADFKAQIHRLHHDNQYPSQLKFNLLD